MTFFYRATHRTAAFLSRLLGGLIVEGLENVPKDGPLLVTSNHISLLDPPVVASAMPREIGFAAKRELFSVPLFGTAIRALNAVPVNRARVSVATIRTLRGFLDEGKGLLFFPEGTRSRSGELGRPKVGVGMMLAEKSEGPRIQVLPTFVEGTDSLFRCLLRRERMRVTFGRPYTLPKELLVASDKKAGSDRKDRYRRVAEFVMDEIRRLKAEAVGTAERETDIPTSESKVSE